MKTRQYLLQFVSGCASVKTFEKVQTGKGEPDRRRAPQDIGCAVLPFAPLNILLRLVVLASLHLTGSVGPQMMEPSTRCRVTDPEQNRERRTGRLKSRSPFRTKISKQQFYTLPFFIQVTVDIHCAQPTGQGRQVAPVCATEQTEPRPRQRRMKLSEPSMSRYEVE
jgi:hypothetical protein